MHDIMKLATIASALAVLAVLWPRSSELALASPDHILLAPVQSFACDGKCEVCAGGDQGHKAYATTGSDRTHNEGDQWHNDCTGTNNCSGHICLQLAVESHQDMHDGAARFLEGIGRAVADSDEKQLRTMLGRYPGSLQYIPERRAVHVLGCTGEVVAHFPLGTVLAEALN